MSDITCLPSALPSLVSIPPPRRCRLMRCPLFLCRHSGAYYCLIATSLYCWNLYLTAIWSDFTYFIVLRELDSIAICTWLRSGEILLILSYCENCTELHTITNGYVVMLIWIYPKTQLPCFVISGEICHFVVLRKFCSIESCI